MDRLCEQFAAPVPSPAGGSAAAATAAIAASLVEMIGRGSPAWPTGAAAAAAATLARDRLLALGAEDVEAVAAAFAGSQRRSAPAHGTDRPDRSATLVRASRVPLEIAECAAEVAELAVAAGAQGRRAMRADADAAAALAATAAQVAAAIAIGNLGALPPDHAPEEIAQLRDAARRAAARAGAIDPGGAAGPTPRG